MDEDKNTKEKGAVDKFVDFSAKFLAVTNVVTKLIWVVAIIIIVASVIKGCQSFKKYGWSFSKNTAEIEVNEPDYELAMKAWEELDYVNAETHFDNALKSSDSKNGTGSLESAAISQKYGAFSLEEGKYDKAYELLNSAYVTFKKELGDSDGNTIISKGQIASYDIHMGRVEEGFASLNDLYDTTTYVSYKLQICQALAQCCIHMQDYKKAVVWYDVLGSLYSQLGVTTPLIVNFINDYGCLQMDIENYPAAIEALEGAKSKWDELNVPEDETLANVYFNLAQAYACDNQDAKAIETMNKALEIRKRLYGENNILVAMSYDFMAQSYGIMCDQETEKKYLDDALKIALDTVGENHMATAIIYLDMGEYHRQTGDLDKAVECHKHALEIRKNILGVNNINTVMVYEALANDYRESGQNELAAENVERAIKITEELYGRDRIYTAHTYITAAWIYSDMGDHDKAMKLAETALGICDRQRDVAGLNRAYAYQTVGYVDLGSGDYENAIKYFEKAKGLYTEVEGESSSSVLTTVYFIGKAQYKNGDTDQAFKTLVDARDKLIDTDLHKDLLEFVDNALRELYEVTAPGIDYDKWLAS